MSLINKRIHILGLGNLGRFFAHYLQHNDRITPISLLFHRPSLYEEWEEASSQIQITSSDLNSSSGSATHTSSKFDIEPTFDVPHEDSPIYNLIVTTKTYKTIEALIPIRHRLTAQSTILFAQNGFGTISTINQELFPDPFSRPQYLTALATHGLFSVGPFKSVHAGEGGISFGHVSPPLPTSSYLANRILGTPAFKAAYFERRDLWNFQLEKLVINAIINPLCTLFRCPNGQLLWVGIPRRPIKNLMKIMLREINQVLVNLQGQSWPVDPDRFTQVNLEILVAGTAKRTRNNICSMLQDALNGNETEIDAINGWIVAEGEKIGVDVSFNKKVVELVKEKKILYDDDIGRYFPGILSQEEQGLWEAEMAELRRMGSVSARKRIYNEEGVCVWAW